jgi:hypothetical protein
MKLNHHAAVAEAAAAAVFFILAYSDINLATESSTQSGPDPSWGAESIEKKREKNPPWTKIFEKMTRDTTNC